jgi:hypothetical protein
MIIAMGSGMFSIAKESSTFQSGVYTTNDEVKPLPQGVCG